MDPGGNKGDTAGKDNHAFAGYTDIAKTTLSIHL
jgi:hypothetical protein